MAATETVPQLLFPRKSAVNKSGVLMLSGFGVRVLIRNGHLEVEDGVGLERRNFRLPRVGHGLRRLVVIGADGFVSLAALRWLADQDAAFVMLERDGSVLATTGPVRPSDARLRRAQALADHSGVALQIARELIDRKLVGQQNVVRDMLHDATAAQVINRCRIALATVESIGAIRLLESQAAAAYWSAWRNLPITFPRKNLTRTPEHWQRFGARISPLSGSPRLAVNPANAMLNYLYALLESEARLAAAALGLDPGLGMMHFDSRTRDSLASDLMEPVRPQVDAFVLDWITREALAREWFFEQRDGNCRLMGSFAVRLSETAPTWGRAVAPIAEWVTRRLWSSIRKPAGEPAPAARLTQSRKRDARGGPLIPSQRPVPRPESVCRVCGTSISPGSSYCVLCTAAVSKKQFSEAARSGRVAAQSPEAQARRAATKCRQDAARRGWLASSQPAWLNNETYLQEIQPRLAGIAYSAIASAIGVSLPYAADIRAGRRRPHPRHWWVLAHLVGVTS